jgi:hypothetical protein
MSNAADCVCDRHLFMKEKMHTDNEKRLQVIACALQRQISYMKEYVM